MDGRSMVCVQRSYSGSCEAAEGNEGVKKTAVKVKRGRTAGQKYNVDGGVVSGWALLIDDVKSLFQSEPQTLFSVTMLA